MTLIAIKERIMKELKESGKTQTTIAKQIGISQQSVSDIMKGKSAPAIDTFARICYMLDLDANYMLGLCTFEGQKKEL